MLGTKKVQTLWVMAVLTKINRTSDILNKLTILNPNSVNMDFKNTQCWTKSIKDIHTLFPPRFTFQINRNAAATVLSFLYTSYTCCQGSLRKMSENKKNRHFFLKGRNGFISVGLMGLGQPKYSKRSSYELINAFISTDKAPNYSHLYNWLSRPIHSWIRRKTDAWDQKFNCSRAKFDSTLLSFQFRRKQVSPISSPTNPWSLDAYEVEQRFNMDKFFHFLTQHERVLSTTLWQNGGFSTNPIHLFYFKL